MREDDVRRLEALERVVRSLVQEVASLRATVEGSGLRTPPVTAPAALAPATAPARDAAHAIPAAQAPASAVPDADAARRMGGTAGAPGAATDRGSGTPPPAYTPPGEPSTYRPPSYASAREGGAPQWNLEELVGRYGTVALGAAVLLAGVGVLVSWAIAQGMFGPRVRLLLAAIVTVIVAATGARLRARGSERYGSVLLALSLALTQLVAWGAGPALQVVPDAVAFFLAAAASLALAVFARANAEEALYTVGVGGALLAPFVTMEGDGAVGLLVYGAIVITGALWSLRRNEWRIAPVLLVVATLAYTGAGTMAARGDAGSWTQVAPFLFALLLAWAAIALSPRPAIALSFLGTALVAGHAWTPGNAAAVPALTALSLLGGVALLTGYATMRGRSTPRVVLGLSALTLPFLSLLVAVHYLPGALDRWDAWLPLLWGMAAGAMTLRDGERAEIHALVATCMGVITLSMLLRDGPALSLSLVGFSVAAIALAARRDLRLPVLVALLTTGLVLIAAYDGLSTLGFDRPFRGWNSAVCAAVVAALLAVARIHAGNPRFAHAATAAAALAAFIWLRFEWARAFSPDAACILLDLPTSEGDSQCEARCRC